MKKKPYTADQLFDIVNNALKEQGLLPSILDYGIATRDVVEVKSEEWDTIGRVNYGSSEGIYLDLELIGNINGKDRRVHLGTYKTLDTNKAAYKAMSDLSVEFVFAMQDFVRQNVDDFNWTGFDIRFYKDGEQQAGVYWAATEDGTDRILKRVFSESDSEYAILVDNATKQERRIERARFN